MFLVGIEKYGTLVFSVKKGKSVCHYAHRISPKISIFCWKKIQFLLQISWDTEDKEYRIKDDTHFLSSFLNSPSVALVFQIARFGEVLRDTYVTLESSHLVIYLFRLCNVTSKALKVLPVKGEEPEVSFARMALFASVRSVLRQGMKVLGVRPLDKM